MSTSKRNFSLKPLFASLLLALGISPIVEADEIFENYNAYNQQTFYAPQLTLGGFYGNNGGSYGEADILYPLMQDPFQLFYMDIRAQKDNASMWQAALGLGYRFLTPDAQQLYGAYVFYNYENSYLNNTLGQMIGGLEFKTNYIGARVNYYHAVGSTKVYEPTQNGISFSGIGGINYNMLVANAYEGQIIQGGTAEIGGPVPYATGLRLFGGYYHFVSNAGQPVIAGPSARMEYRFEEALNLQVPFVERFTFESTWQHDQVNGNLWTVGFRLTMPMGYTNSNTGLQKEMTDYVRFNQLPPPYVAYETPTINQTNGHNTVFAFVNSENDFNTALSQTEDVIVINQNINVQGNQTLPDNIVITGQNFEYQPGLVTNVTGKNTISNIAASNGTSVFYVGQNNAVQDLQVNQAISNTGGSSVGNLTINNITSANGGINIDVTDGGNNSNIAVNSSNFTLNGGTAISIQATNNSTVNVSGIENNTITAINGVNNASGIYLLKNDGATFSFYNVFNNTITFQTGNGNTGIYVENAGLPNTTGSPNGITYNTITIGSFTGAGDSQGIWINNTATGTQVVDAISNNTITIGDSGSIANQFAGINITNNGTSTSAEQNVNFLDQNNITVTQNNSGNEQFILGINIYAKNETTQNISNINQNVFNFSGNPSGIDAISVWAASNSTINITNFYNNSTTGAQNEDIAVTTSGGGVINISTGVNTPGNASGANALSAANNGIAVNADSTPPNSLAGGAITITDNG